ncbi:CU044_5270 family protein [Actinocorallia aurantiaca]|uniref:CU044_5270 family protein n=1 Tax=Actinocorallia aurantiaca TaxID=46204 RepID=A0ABN3TVK2_9ACTN
MTIDEIEIFRDGRPEAAPYDPVSRARARSRLLDGPRPRRLPRWTLAVSAATAGALALGLFLLPGDDSTRIAPSAHPVSAVEYLEKAARVVEKRPDVRPGPHQWLYEKTLIQGRDGRTEHSAETWKRLDGQQASSGNGRDGKPAIDGPYLGRNERSPLQRYDHLRTLSTDPKKLLARAYKAVDDRFAKRKAQLERMPNPYRDYERGELKEDMMEDNRHRAAYHEIAELFEGVLTPPRLHAAAFRAIARIPGVEVLPEGADPLGRPVVTVARMDQYGLRYEYLLDPETYASRGRGAVVVRNDLRQRSGGASMGEDGRITPMPMQVRRIGEGDYELRETAGIVDEVGRLPG